MTGFSSMLGERLTAYVKLQRALGFQFKSQAVVLHEFDRYLLGREENPRGTCLAGLGCCEDLPMQVF